MDIVIRKYKSSDKKSIIRLWKEIFNPIDFHNKPEIAINMKIKHSDNLLFVAEKDKQLVGTVITGFDGHRGWIYSLAVSPKYRRRGIGTLLLKKAVNELEILGCLKVNLQINGDESDVVNFYKKLGFNVEDRISMGLKLY